MNVFEVIKSIPKDAIFPIAIIIQFFIAGVICMFTKNWNNAVYFICGAVINLSVIVR